MHVQVDWSPAYELVASLEAYRSTVHQRLDLGARWARTVLKGTGLARSTWDDLSCSNWLIVLAWHCPGERDAEGLIRWLAGQTAGELYDRLAPYAFAGKAGLPTDLAGWRDAHLAALSTWHEAYFRTVDPAILMGLRAEAVATRGLLETLPAAEVVERATRGLHYTPGPDVTDLLLVPQHHYRPWNLHERLRGLKVLLYPADVVTPAPGDVPTDLLRLTQALGDESRLSILRYLAGGERSFTEVVHDMGLAKSTVHYHMVALRAAGLVRVHDADTGVMGYSLRRHAVAVLGERLTAFLDTAAEPAGPPDHRSVGSARRRARGTATSGR